MAGALLPKRLFFSLNNNEGLEPFVRKVKKEFTGNAIYRSSSIGPRFAGVHIGDNADSNSNSRARLGYRYSVPPAVQDSDTVLAGTSEFSSPDEVEVFYLDPSR